MRYERNDEILYNHYFYEERNIYLLGVSKQFSKGMASLLIDNGIKIINPKIFRLDPEDRYAFFDALEKAEEKKDGKKKSGKEKAYIGKTKRFIFVGEYWRVLADFIFYISGQSLWDLTEMLLDVLDYIDAPVMYEDKWQDRKYLYDMMDKMRNNKGQVNDVVMRVVRMICLRFGITEEIVQLGRGHLYCIWDSVKNPQKVKMTQIAEYCKECESTGKILNVKDMMKKFMVLEDDDISEVSLQIVMQNGTIDKKIQEFADSLLDLMIKSRK